MLEKMSEKLYAQLSDEITAIISRETEPFQILSLILKKVREALKTLKDHIRNNPFKDDQQQIWFFKTIKPKFYCLRIYYLEWYSMVTNVPAGDEEHIKRFYLDELKAVQRFFQRIAFHYQYYRLNATELDHLYFIRGTQAQSVLIPEVLEIDPEFSTSQDFLFAKIKAYELLQDFILKQISELDPRPAPQEPAQKPQDTNILTWTGDKTNLVEVIYGMFYTGQLNNGNASVADIIKWMERHFHIDLKLAYRKFLDIRTRKRDSHTRYLDRMRASIQQRVDEDNQYKPNRGIKLNHNPGNESEE
jgi:hypothetical protein